MIVIRSVRSSETEITGFVPVICLYVPTITHETAVWHGRHKHIRARSLVRLKSRRENMEPQGAYKKYKRLWGGGGCCRNVTY